MLSTKYFIILFSIFSFSILSPDFSKAAIYAQGYDFGNVEVDSIARTSVSITNISNQGPTSQVVLILISFAPDSCRDFSIETSLETPIAIQPGKSLNVEIGYSPTFVGECSATLNIFTEENPESSYEVIFTGMGVEQKSEQPEPDNISQLLLEKLQKIIDYTNDSYTYQALRSYEQNRELKGRRNTFKTKLVVCYHLIENGHFEAAENKLNEIHKKTDGKPESNDFLPPKIAANVALMLQDLIACFDFEDK